jgi:CyaY protein
MTEPNSADLAGSFVAAAEKELKALVEALDRELEELDAELSGDILTLELAPGRLCIINRHGAARQIWMAADRMAWHFDHDAATGRWIASKDQAELWATLSTVLTRALGKTVVLRPGT